MLVFYIILPSFNLPMNAKVGITLLSMPISNGINYVWETITSLLLGEPFLPLTSMPRLCAHITSKMRVR